MPNPDGTLRVYEYIKPGTMVESIHRVNMGCRGRVTGSRTVHSNPDEWPGGKYRTFTIDWCDRETTPDPGNRIYAESFIKVVSDGIIKELGIGHHINNRR